MKRWIGLGLLVFVSFFAHSQTWVIDDFNSNTLDSAWNVTGNTFAIALEDSLLKVDYNRASGGAWDQFQWKANQNITIASYKIQFKLKSDVAFKLNIKPVYTNSTNDWLEEEISSSSSFNNLEFQVQKDNSVTIETIYFYFDGGSSTDKSGIAFLDDIIISGTIVIEKLDELITSAETFISNVESSDYPSSNITAFQTAIDAAKSVSTSPENQIQVENATEDLYLEFSKIESSYIVPNELEEIKLAASTATKQTLILYHNLKELSGEQFLFGHQDATGYGIGWNNDNDRSDVKSVCGSYPALAGWGLSWIAQGNTDESATYRAEKFYNMGAVNAFEWHMDNPYGGDFYWENRQTDDLPVPALIPGGEKHEFYKTQLQNIAKFFRDLRGQNGESVPVIFRPFHEHTGDWFWWGDAHCTVEDYKELWQFTVEYMRDSLHLHNVIYAYSPDRFSYAAEYLEKYPGDDYVDILGFDDYWNLRNSSGKNSFINELEIVGELAEEKGKICALTETGLETITNNTWFTDILLDPILTNEKTKRIAFAMVWRNANTSHFYAPYPGHASSADFINFYNNPTTLFVNDKLPKLYELDFGTSNSVIELDTHEINIYPNPAQSKIYIDVEPGSVITLYNLSGQAVKQINLTGNFIDISDVNPGLHIIRVAKKNQSTSIKKVLVQ
ncbi:glycosyl hydrolase [uncultured Draconibacterium sp.]|uniref:glycosyl hydrolase n=1 Tax=uncultured Draconibacterium sp. TaxID=1573823 RepID=UPI0029C0DC27|nr:glycosyl hydrolase [uncultured Draconibacterium sp.]